MINALKNHIRVHKEAYSIGTVLFISFIARLWYTWGDTSVWWDGAVYVGMGKYIATGGSIGLWEMFRPPLFPLFYSILFILHIPLVLVGKAVVIFSSIGSIWLVYKLAESVRKGSGMYAGIFLSITPVFFTFSKVPITDIISVFFALLALSLQRKKKYFISGIVVAISFLLRFPQGLMLFSIVCITIIESYDHDLILWVKHTFINGLLLGAGFIALVGPYLISNHFLYGNALIPLVVGNKIIGGYSYLYNLGTWYYAKELLKTAPFLYFSIFAPFLLFKKYHLSYQEQKNLRAVIVTAFIFCFYFFWQSHKELRYSIAFIPYISILASVSFTFLFSRILERKEIIVLFFGLLIIFLYQSFPYLIKGKQVDPYTPVYSYMSTLKGSYISTSPVPAVLSDVRIVEFFDSVITFEDALTRRASTLDGAVVTMCDLSCDLDLAGSPSCSVHIKDLLKKKTTFTESYENTINGCTVMIFKK